MVSGTMAAAVPMEVPTKKARHRDHRHQQDDEGRRAHRIDQQAGDAVEGDIGQHALGFGDVQGDAERDAQQRADHARDHHHHQRLAEGADEQIDQFR
jgi:hypothetical protein